MFLDQYEEKELWQPFDLTGPRHYPQTPAYSVSTFTNLCKLCIVMNEILNQIYTGRSQDLGEDTLIKYIRALHTRLEEWYHSLEGHLNFDASNSAQIVPPPSVLSLL